MRCHDMSCYVNWGAIRFDVILHCAYKRTLEEYSLSAISKIDPCLFIANWRHRWT